MSVLTLRYVINLMSPTVVTSTHGYRGMTYTTVSDYLLGSVVRGALLTAMLNEGLITEESLTREARRPRHYVTPALYAPHDLSDVIPFGNVAFAHALSYKFKVRDEVLSFGIGRLLERLRSGKEVLDALSELIFETSISLDVRAYSGALEDQARVFTCSAEAKGVSGSTIVRDGGAWRVVKPPKGIYVENAVERSRGSAAHGALYAYEYLEPGSRFAGLIFMREDSELRDAISTLAGSCINVRIGRGLGRGFGIARLCLNGLTLPEGMVGEQLIRGGGEEHVVIYSASPTFTLNLGPRPIKEGDEVTLKVFDNVLAEAKVLAVIGRSVIKHYGWSYRTGLPKLPIKALAPGTLLVAKLRAKAGGSSTHLETPLVITDEFSSQGFNIVAVLTKDFIGGEA